MSGVVCHGVCSPSTDRSREDPPGPGSPCADGPWEWFGQNPDDTRDTGRPAGHDGAVTSLSRRCLVCAIPAGAALPLALGAPANAAGTKVIATKKVPVGGGRIIDRDDLKVVVTQPTAGSFRVFSAICTHQGCVVSSISKKKIGCACHGSQFKISNGAVVTGPATKGLPKRAFTIKDGVIYLA